MKVSIIKYIVDKIKRSLAIVQDGDTATRNIAKDKFVNWKGNIYTANQAIASGSTLSAASGGNLTACDDGALNKVGSDVSALNSKKADKINLQRNGTTVTNVSDLAALKSLLLTEISNRQIGEAWEILINCQFDDGNIKGGMWRISLNYPVADYWSGVMVGYTGNGTIMTICYLNGTWTFNNITKGIETLNGKLSSINGTVKTTGSVEPYYHCMGFALDPNYVTFYVHFPFITNDTDYNVQIGDVLIENIGTVTPSDYVVSAKYQTGLIVSTTSLTCARGTIYGARILIKVYY